MKSIFTEHIIQVNNIDLHYIEYKNHHPKILLMHGLTANAYAFEGLIQAGLADSFHVFSVDLRGRGLSSKPAFAYSIQDHAADMIALLDALNIEHVILCGHSFGGLLATYLACNFNNRFSKIIILDAAPNMNPRSAEMLGPAIARIDKHYDNFETYLKEIRRAPYLTFWDDAMMAYYKADVATAADNSVEPRSNINDIIQIALAVSKEPWTTWFEEMMQAALLVNAIEDYTLDMPLLPETKAREVAAQMKNCKYIAMQGNHQTMLYGEHASFLTAAISAFAL